MTSHGVRLADLSSVSGRGGTRLRTSSTNRSGSSSAAKCPPRSSWFQCRMSVYTPSAHRREAPKSSFLNCEIPAGTATVGAAAARSKLSQYKRPDEAAVLLSQ